MASEGVPGVRQGLFAPSHGLEASRSVSGGDEIGRWGCGVSRREEPSTRACQCPWWFRAVADDSLRVGGGLQPPSRQEEREHRDGSPPRKPGTREGPWQRSAAPSRDDQRDSAAAAQVAPRMDGQSDQRLSWSQRTTYPALT
jgi:hypothetical protein